MINTMLTIHNELGEGIFFDKKNNSLLWLDINKSMLFVFCNKKLEEYQLGKNASAILFVEDKIVTLVDKEGINNFCLISRNINQISKTPMQYCSTKYRANDGIKLDNNLYMYGVMGLDPIKDNGALILSENGKTKIIMKDIAIPNTFIKIPNSNSLLISDSLKQKVFRFDFDNSWNKVINKKEWLSFENSNKVPDGGCISSIGRIFIAIWDGFEILEFDLEGNNIDKFEIPVPRPTNCTLNEKEDQLFVTSAYEGLSDYDYKKYPLSGSIFTIDLNK
ncbi:SMP-30/gluconolactonase/LRE family protein [Pelagibacteraceae bacterium]|nr:SMP-30/gluconolactonase/LRE family protein [Pelagibacteraceae bacterium]